MPYRVDLAFQVEEALAELSEDSRQEVMELIAEALVDPNSWPRPGGWDWALRCGPRLWIVTTAYLDGIDIVSLGANDDLVQGRRSSPPQPDGSTPELLNCQPEAED